MNKNPNSEGEVQKHKKPHTQMQTAPTRKRTVEDCYPSTFFHHFSLKFFSREEGMKKNQSFHSGTSKKKKKKNLTCNDMLVQRAGRKRCNKERDREKENGLVFFCVWDSVVMEKKGRLIFEHMDNMTRTLLRKGEK